MKKQEVKTESLDRDKEMCYSLEERLRAIEDLTGEIVKEMGEIKESMEGDIQKIYEIIGEER